MANRPAPRPPIAVTSGTTRGVFIAFGIAGAVLIAALAFILGQTAVNPTGRGLEQNLVLVRQKAATCSQERDRLRAKAKREPDYRKSPAYKIQEENDRLADQNNELMTDNESLRDEKAMLEETLTELRFDLDKNSVITEEESRKLENFERTGNMSDSLAAFIQDQKLWGGVDKDELLTKLMDELKWKKQQYQKCTKDIIGAKEKLEKAKAAKTQKDVEKPKETPKEEAKPVVDASKLDEEELKKLLAKLKAKEPEKPVVKEAKPVEEKKEKISGKSDPTIEELVARLEAEKLKQNPVAKAEKPAEAAGEKASVADLLAQLKKQEDIVQKEKPAVPEPKLSAEQIAKLLAQLQK